VSTEAAPQPPAIPDYELLRLIGRGAYGEVWLARGVTGVYRAVKLVWRDRFPEAGPYEREFHGLREFAAISLSESRQLALLHVGRDPAAAYFYYVMELADDVATGREIDPANYTPLTLKEMRARTGRLSAGECVTLGVELARALSGLHARGLVHRDIKPSNVIIVGGAPKLADIGLVTEASAALTFVGTEGFVPPEGPGAPSADVFALGKLLYELLTGLDRHDYPRLPAELHAWPDRKEALELNEVLIRACEPHPDHRHTDAAALLEDLLLLQAGRSVRQLRRAERRVTRALRLGVLLALIATIAGLGAYLERQRANQEMAGRLAAEAERDLERERSKYASLVNQAQQAITAEEFGWARELLRQAGGTPDTAELRGFEWHVLKQGSMGDFAVTLWAQGPAITRLAVSPARDLLAAQDEGKTVTLWRTPGHDLVRKIPGIQRLAGFSADGTWVLGLDAEGRLQRWRAADGVADGQPAGGGPYRPLCAQGNDRVVALREGADPELIVWDFASHSAVMRIALSQPGNPVPWEFFRGGMDETGRRIAFAWIRGRSSDSTYRLTFVDLAPSGAPRLVHQELPQRPGLVGADEAGAWALMDDTGALWRCPTPETGWQAMPETLFAGIRKRLAAGPDGRQLVAARDRLIWLNAAHQPTRLGRGHQGTVSDVILGPAGWSYSATRAGELRAWPAVAPESAPAKRQVWDSRAGTTRAVFSPDSRLLAVPLNGRDCVILDVATLETQVQLPGMRFPLWFGPAEVAGFAADGRGLVVLSARTGALIRRIAPDFSRTLRGLASADGRDFCLLSADDALWLGRAGANAIPPLAKGGYQNRFAIAGDPALERFWSAGSDTLLRCQSLPDGREIWSRRLSALAPDLKLLPDGRRLVVPLENGQLEICDAATGAVLHVATGGTNAPQSVAVSADGRRVFIAGFQGDVHCLETTSWQKLATFRLPENQPLQTLAVAPDGSAVATLSKSGLLQLLRVRPESPDAH
jgi:WD40 repeat protein